MPRRIARAAGIALGYWIDRRYADPRRFHPVAGFGKAASLLETVTYRDNRVVGVAHTAALVTSVALTGWALEHVARGSAVATVAVNAAATWACLGGTSLVHVSAKMSEHLSRDELDCARSLLPSLCGRDPACLDASDLIRATVESLAENTSDAHVGPVFWAAIGGVPGVVVYRAVNTLDAMIGHKSARYTRFGWAAARLDDVLNIAPARATGLAVVLAARHHGGSPVSALRSWWRDARLHPSPNAGVAEATFAGALGVQLGGLTQYAYGVEHRPTLGDGVVPGLGDLTKAIGLSQTVQLMTVAATCLVLGVSAFARSGRRACPR